jgi:hypothetical protein
VLPPTSDFPGLEAEECPASAFAVNPHRTGLWHKVRRAANALGMKEEESKRSFGALGACPPNQGRFMSSVYRLLVRQGLDRPRLIAEGSGPTKAFETELANALWMADVMDGPTLRAT